VNIGNMSFVLPICWSEFVKNFYKRYAPYYGFYFAKLPQSKGNLELRGSKWTNYL